MVERKMTPYDVLDCIDKEVARRAISVFQVHCSQLSSPSLLKAFSAPVLRCWGCIGCVWFSKETFGVRPGCLRIHVCYLYERTPQWDQLRTLAAEGCN